MTASIRHWAIVPIAGILALPMSATADLGYPVNILLQDGSILAVNGQLYTNSLHVELPAGGVLDSLTFVDNAWSTVSLEQSPSGDLPPGTVLTLAFEVVPSDTELPLVLTGVWNGYRIDTSFDLSLRAYERINTARGLIGAEPLNLTPPAGWVNPIGTSPSEPIIVPAGEPGEKDRTITVSGELCYIRADGQPMPAYGVMAEVRDDDAIGSNLLGSAIVDIDGTYSVTFTWQEGILHENHPDIFVYFKAKNDVADVQANVWPLSTNVYRWKSSVHQNFTGTSLDMGSLQPADEEDHIAFHILANICKTYAWLDGKGYAPEGKVDIVWPEGNNAEWLGETLDLMRISESAQWSEDTHAHEYGHRWMFKFDVDTNTWPDYCNDGGYHDDGPGCGHTDWCEENEYEAWGEGVPDWIADLVTRAYEDDFIIACSDDGFRKAENVKKCGEDDPDRFHDPFITEGFVHALLWDIVDRDNQICGDELDPCDDQADLTSDYIDCMDLTSQEVLDHLVAVRPQTIAEFIDSFYPTLGNPRLFWETAANLGFSGIDTWGAPEPIPGLNSTSHEIGVESPDNTIDFEWGQPDDNFSGTVEYLIVYFEESGAVTENHTLMNDGAGVMYTTEPLQPGSWSFTFVAIDREGNDNWPGGEVEVGPYLIREPLPADIAFGQNLGAAVAGPLVLRDDDTASPDMIQWSSALPGDSGGIYWNAVTTNLGDEAVSEPFMNRILIDGQIGSLTNDFVSSLPGLTNHTAVNLGPMYVRGGLHTVSVRYDGGEHIAEPEETNNSTAVQLTFIPPLLSAGTVATRSAPPDPLGGSEDFQDVDPTLRPDNKDGLRFDASSGFHALVAWADDDADDYNCLLYPPANTILGGFGYLWQALGASLRVAGLIDAVIVNANQELPHSEFDVGIVNRSGGVATYTAAHRVGSLMDLETPIALTMGAARRLLMRTFDVDAGSAGWKTATLTANPDAGKFHLAWYPANFMYGALANHSAHTTTDETGAALLNFDASLTGRHLLVVWRDPADDPAAKAAVVSLELVIATALPDLVMMAEPPSWYSPIVPRPDQDGTPSTVFAPPQLLGGVAATYMNVNIFNQGQTDAQAFVAELGIDGEPLAAVPLPACPAGGNTSHNGLTAYEIRAGRHTLSVDIDPAGSLEEASVANNRFSEQYVWLPPDTTSPGLSYLPAPLGAVAGWNAITLLRGPLRYNADGHYMPVQPGTWYGAAIQPAPDTDVDLRLHEIITDAKTGFADPIAFSGWGIGKLDFILVNTLATAARPFHLGAIGVEGTGGYLLDYIHSSYLATAPSGTYGPFSLGANELVQLREVTLTAGSHHIALDDKNDVDLMFSIHGGSIPYGSRSRPISDGESLWIPGRSREAVDVEITEDGSYCLAVWRRDGAGVSLPPVMSTAIYTIDFGDITSVDDHSPPAIALQIGPNFPNPFNPRTSIRLELPAPGLTTVVVYDVAGRLVKTLLNQYMPAGSHEVVWTGQDARGREAAAGIYFYRVTSSAGAAMGKMTLAR